MDVYFFICNHRGCPGLLKFSKDSRKISDMWEIKEKLRKNLYIPDFNLIKVYQKKKPAHHNEE